MRNPTSTLFNKIQELHATGRMVGKDRPVGRITYAKQMLQTVSSSKKGVGNIRYMDQDVLEQELLNIRTIEIDRSIGTDAATCTITMWNVRPDFAAPEGVDASGSLGYLTPGRGESHGATVSVFPQINPIDPITGLATNYVSDWGYAVNRYRDVLIPNTVLRTYQGYGSDNFDANGNERPPNDPSYVEPKEDSQLYQTGVWLIDNVVFQQDGQIQVTCRDYAKLLIEQYIYPPMIPLDRFPLIYCPAHGPTGVKESIGKNVAVFNASSVDRVYGANAKIKGHKGSDAFDGNDHTYWLSGPNDSSNNVEWIQAKTKGPVNELVLDIPWGNYVLYISVHMDGHWLGTSNITGTAEDHTSVENLSVGKGDGGDGYFTHTVVSGDTLWDLAGKYYGDNTKWPIIADANQNIIKDPHWIYPGEVLRIPYVKGTLSPPKGSTAAAGGAHSSYPTTYTVVKGDTLWDIAVHYYGDGTLWPKIYDANKSIIKDPHWIYPGQKFHIPYVPGTPFTPPKPSVPPAGGSGTHTGGTKLDIPYVFVTTATKSGKVTISLPQTYDCDYIRVVFTQLHNTGGGDYRAALYEFTARNHIGSTYLPSTLNENGYIQDWVEPIKEMCAWGGFGWLTSGGPADVLLGTTATSATVAAIKQKITSLKAKLHDSHTKTADKPAIQTQIDLLNAELATEVVDTSSHPIRVWGDFEVLGAGPIVCSPADYFLSKSFMEGIRLIVDFIGGIFFIDESGGAQFRLPNIWTGGNYIFDPTGDNTLNFNIPQHPIEFHDDANIVTYQMTISDEALRSEVLVIGGYPSVNSTGPVAGGYVLGYDPATGTTSAIDFSNVLAGQYRLMVVPGDNTKLFYTELECQRMAELTALFILFTYRQGNLHAPCHPALQIDDQVRIYERVTGESNIHYVSSLKTLQNLETGEYTMDLTTHWLGPNSSTDPSEPNTNWFVNKAQLTPAVLDLPAILARIGNEAGDGAALETPPYG